MKKQSLFVKTLSVLLAVLFVFGAAPIMNFSDIIASAASESDLTFTLINDGTEYEVSDCDQSASGELIIPSSYNDLPVTGIADGAFYCCQSLTSITIPDSVTYIGDLAFYWCTSLVSVTLPNNITSIGANAFSLCGSLQNIIIPDGVITIDRAAFCYCVSLTSINIPVSVKCIGDYAFSGCESLEEVDYPGSFIKWLSIDIGEMNDELINSKIKNSLLQILVYFPISAFNAIKDSIASFLSQIFNR